MSKEQFKSILLVFLLSLSVYQVGQLWFEDLSGHNFFYHVIVQRLEGYKKNQPTERHSLNKPHKVVVYFGDSEKEFVVLSNTRGEAAEFQKIAQDVLKVTMQRGEYTGSFSLNPEKGDGMASLWKFPGVILDYRFSFPFTSLPWELGIKSLSYGKEIGSFDQIWLLVNQKTQGAEYQAFFINQQEQMAHQVVWKVEQPKEPLMELMKQLESKQFWTYSSSKKDGLSKFEKNVFLPVNTQESYVNQVVFLENPILEDGEINEELLEEMLNPFFENYTLKWMIKKENNRYVYGDDGIIIKYFPEGIIEYSNQTIQGKKGEMSLEEGYQVAKTFLNRDQQLTRQEYDLVSYEKTADGYYFYFDYSFYDFPYIISENIKEELGINYPIEIWVQNYQVKVYRRWIMEQKHLSIYFKEMQDTYTAAYDRLARRLTTAQKQAPIQDLFLGYYQENIGENPQLSWIFSIDDQWYYERVK
ncbi:MAG: hypothetical protein GX962_11220 [Epulopiscium sp.]|nr:hypothetical protein [Candidatus Epulonipiscium sp.]